MTNFTEDVKFAFLPNAEGLGFGIVGEQSSESFGDALVIAQSGEMRLRMVRDRSQIFADLGSVAEPDTWFDSPTVLQALGLTTHQPFGGTDPRAVLPSIAACLKSVWRELVAMFDSQHFAETKRQLTELQDAGAAEKWG